MYIFVKSKTVEVMENKNNCFKYKAIVMSDIHLGSKWSKTEAATNFLKNNSCEILILCGDIIDGWALKRSGRKGGRWDRDQTNFIRTLFDIADKTKIIYVRGNHDDFLDRVVPIKFLNLDVVQDYVYESNNKRYFVLHGDIFDKVTSSMAWLSKIGDVGYSILLWFNKYYNQRRERKGLPYYSIAKVIKQKVKASVSHISNFEGHIVDLAKSCDYDGVICGHIHCPEIKNINGVEYLNSGDWVESLSALVEDYDGNWSLYIEEKQEEENTTK